MKKLLFSTSALIGALSLAGVAYAGGEPGGSNNAGAGLGVTVGGHIDFQAGFSDQDTAFETGVHTREAKIQNDTEIHLGVEGRSDNGLTYGAVIELETDVTADGDGEGGNADKTYIYLESNAGRVELGANTGAQGTMKVDASTIARASGGVDGDWYDFVNISGLAGTATFIVSPDLPSDHGSVTAGDTEDSTKITYYTPRYSGAQLGISFTPDDGNVGTAAAFSTETDAGDQENVFGIGLNYQGEMDNVGYEISATGEFGDSEVATTEDLSAWAIGALVSFQNFSLAGSWADWDDSGLAVGSGDDSNFWTLGGAYETGPFGVSITYLASEYEAGATDNEFTNLSVGADYLLAPGLVPYVEVTFFDLDEASTTTDNDGSVLLIGAELTF